MVMVDVAFRTFESEYSKIELTNNRIHIGEIVGISQSNCENSFQTINKVWKMYSNVSMLHSNQLSILYNSNISSPSEAVRLSVDCCKKQTKNW